THSTLLDLGIIHHCPQISKLNITRRSELRLISYPWLTLIVHLFVQFCIITCYWCSFSFLINLINSLHFQTPLHHRTPHIAILVSGNHTPAKIFTLSRPHRVITSTLASRNIHLTFSRSCLILVRIGTL